MADFKKPEVIPETKLDTINRLVSELCLGTSFPLGTGKRSLVASSAAATSIGNILGTMPTSELKSYRWLVEPLITLMKTDIYNTACSKASYALKTLMFSHVCIVELIESELLQYLAKIMEVLLSKNVSDIGKKCDNRNLVENLAICYREVSRSYLWDIVNVGGIRHCVILMKHGDTAIKTVA